MSAVKHQPATPLPWFQAGEEASKQDGCSYTLGADQQTVVDHHGDNSNTPEVNRANQRYKIHAANAYPKSIVAARSLTVVPNGIDKMSAADLRAHIREQSDRATVLLRDLGEAS